MDHCNHSTSKKKKSIMYRISSAAAGGSVWAIVALGLLSIVHTLSHLLPALGVLGYAIEEQAGEHAAEHAHEALMLFGINFGAIIFHPVMQIAYILFVPLSFYYMFADHKHHKELHRLEHELEHTKKELAAARKKRK